MDKYPRLTFGLNQHLLTKVNQLSLPRHRTRGQIIRQALEMYYPFTTQWCAAALTRNSSIPKFDDPTKVCKSLLETFTHHFRVNN